MHKVTETERTRVRMRGAADPGSPEETYLRNPGHPSPILCRRDWLGCGGEGDLSVVLPDA